MATELGVCGAPGSGAPNWTQYEPNAAGHRPDHPSDGPQCQGPPGRLPQEAGTLTRRCAGSSTGQGGRLRTTRTGVEPLGPGPKRHALAVQDGQALRSSDVDGTAVAGRQDACRPTRPLELARWR